MNQSTFLAILIARPVTLACKNLFFYVWGIGGSEILWGGEGKDATGDRLKYTFIGVASPCVYLAVSGAGGAKKKQQPRLHCSYGTDRHSPSAQETRANYRSTIDGAEGGGSDGGRAED